MPDSAVIVLATAGILILVWLSKMSRELRPKQPPPAFVSSILNGRVVIEGGAAKIRPALESSPYSSTLVVDPPGFLAVQFNDEGSRLENAQLHELLSWLKDQGVAFSVDRGWGPAEVMEGLFVHGRIKGRFKTIYWTGPGKWHVSDTYPGAP